MYSLGNTGYRRNVGVEGDGEGEEEEEKDGAARL